MIRLLLGILLVAAVATIGDYIWYEFGVRHRLIAGVMHGAVLLTAVGGTIGAASGRVWAGLPLGTIAGIFGALLYYTLAPVMGNGAMLVAWAALWVVLAVLDGAIVRRGRRPFSRSLAQGALAACGAGLTFYLVVGILWGRPPAGGRNYFVQYAAWALAWAPGILAIGLDVLTPTNRTRVNP